MPRQSSELSKLPAFDLKAEREKRELTQAECARVLFTNQSNIQRWENNGMTPPIYREYWSLYWQHAKPSKAQKKPAK